MTHKNSLVEPAAFHRSPARAAGRLSKKVRAAAPLLLLAALFLLAGCAETGQMVDQSRYDVMEPSTLFADGRSARPIVPGTVPYMAEGSPSDPALTGLGEDGQPVEAMPVEVDAALLATGRERYQIFCTPCHGPAGAGDGNVVKLYKFPQPPSLVEGSELTDGQIFDVITNGKGNMFPYGYRVKAPERWAVVAYIRAMQLRGGAVDPQELTPEEINQLGGQQ
jgi:mono/diheme cytochrome c family protein